MLAISSSSGQRRFNGTIVERNASLAAWIEIARLT